MLSGNFLKHSTLFLYVSLSIFLSSCRYGDDAVKPPPQPLPPPVESPDNSCALYFVLGYTDKVSYSPDEEVSVFIKSMKVVDLCRLDVYDVNQQLAFSVESQLNNLDIINSHPAEEGFGLFLTVKFTIPDSLKSGVYLIEKKVPFIVKPAEPVDILVVYPSNTANAYSESGGKSLYTGPQHRAYTVSFHRPVDLQAHSTECLTWFSKLEHLNIGYVADQDLDDYNAIKDSRILAIVGHNEYWTRAGRQNFDKFVNNGGHALVLSGNTMWWQVRYTEDKSGLICYKSSDLDPEPDPLLKTIEWTSSSLEYSILSSIGADFPHGGYGSGRDLGWNGFMIVNPASPLLLGLNLGDRSIISCLTSEYDGAPLAGFDSRGFPILDKAALNFEKIELIGFDWGFRANDTVGTFIVMQKSRTSGIIVNTGSTDWCSSNGMGGPSGAEIKMITLNAIARLLNGETLFSE